MLFSALVGALLAASIAFSSLVPSDETLRIAFDRGQRFYVIEDYEQAIEKFEIVKQAEDSRFVDETQVLIQVGELNFPVKVAATFQLANAHSNLAVNRLDKASREADERRAEDLRREADEHFRKAAELFKEAGESTDLLEIEVLSQYRLIKALFQAQDYRGVITAARKLIEEYPQSDYVDEGLYEMGWAYFNLGEFSQAIQAFEQLAERNSADYRIDRAQFQIGKSYFEQEKYPEAREALGSLVSKYDFSHLSEGERVKMEAQKLSGVVKETAIELVAKSQLLIGDTFTAQGNVEDATSAYRQVIDNYPQERRLVEDAYTKIGEAHFELQDIDGGVQVYRRSIDEVSDPGFRARMQARIARQYYEAGDFSKAREEYEIYINAYGLRAQEGGLSLDRVRFQIAQCIFEMGEEQRQAGNLEDARPLYSQSQEVYLQVIQEYSDTDLRAESLFGAGLAAQLRDEEESRMVALELFERIQNEFPQREEMVARAHLQTARIHYIQKDFVEAGELYEAYLKRFAGDEEIGRINFELALVYRNTERPDDVVTALERIPTESPVWSKAGLLGGDYLLRLGRLDQAGEMLQRAMAVQEKDAQTGELYYVLGRVNFEQGKLTESVEAFGTALATADKESILHGALLGRGTAFYQMGDNESAVGDLEELLTGQPALNLKDQAHRLLGQCYVRMGRRAEAIKDYMAIIEASDDPQEKAEYTLLLGELFYSLERYPEAIEKCNEVIGLDFADADNGRGYMLEERAYFVMGDAYSRQENYREASRTFSMALKLFPRGNLSSDLLFGKAVAQFVLEEFEAVVSLLNEFIDRFPQNPNLENAYYFLAYSHLRETEFSKAAEWFGKLADRYPDSEAAAEALFQQGENFFNLTQYEDAAAAYSRVVGEQGSSEFVDNAIYNMGWCYFELDRAEEAVEKFGELLDRFPDSQFAPSAQFTLGDYHFNQKEYEAAALAYNSVIKNYPKSEMVPEAQSLLDELEEIKAYLDYEEAMALFDQEDYPRAAEALQKVVDAHLETETRAGAMANLGMSYEFLRKWKDAAQVYEQLVSSYSEQSESTAAVAFAREHLNWITKNRL